MGSDASDDEPSDEPTDGESADLQYHVAGELVPAEEATVSVHDRGFMYGDAAFETMRVYGGTPFRWNGHLDRLEHSCELLSIPWAYSRAELRERVAETLRANDLADARVRLSITRGESSGLAPPEDADPTVVIQISSLPRGGTEGEETWDDPEVLQTVKTQRVPDRAIPSAAKTHNYLNAILARLETRVSDADEALMLDAEGNVAEAATANLWFVTDDALRTPSLDGPILPGITREVVLEIARSEGIPVEEGTYTPDDVRNADEAFLTSSIREIRPVAKLDGVEIGGGPVTTLLSRLYDARVENVCYAAETDAE
jgi:branched-chain amino acid aminotransferase